MDQIIDVHICKIVKIEMYFKMYGYKSNEF